MASIAPLTLLKLVRSVNKNIYVNYIILFNVNKKISIKVINSPSSDSGASPEIMVPQ